MKALACTNLKGGVGKTAIAVNFAAYCGRRGKRTLLIDLDPQTNATFSCISVDQWDEHSKKNGTVADLLEARSHNSAEGKKRSAADVIIKNVFPNVDLIPSHLDLFTIDLDMAGVTARETKLRRSLQDVKDNYDIIICDCPPNLTIPTQNALTLCSHYVIPVSPDYLSVLGVALLISRISVFCKDMELNLELAGIVLSRVGRTAIHRAETAATLRQQFTTSVLSAELRERAAVSESAASQKCIFDLSNREAASEFESMSQELISRIKF